MIITPIYAALATLFFVFLSFRVIGLRRSEKISLGDGGNAQLLARQRIHGNFSEYVPMVIVLMMLAELQNGQSWILHAMGVTIILARLMHAYAISQSSQIMPMRVVGMVLTFFTLIAGALVNLSMAVG